MPVSEGSSRGYHYISDFRSCPRKWFLSNVAGLKPTAQGTAASMGSAIHAMQEQFYNGGYREDIIEYRSDAALHLADYREAWFEQDEFDAACDKVGVAFMVWRQQFGFDDLVKYDVVGIESELRAALPNGIEVTGRIDRLMRDKSSGHLVLFDTKTTSWSPETAQKKVEINDQVTMYTWLLQKRYGDTPIEMWPDIVYLKPKVPTCHRFGPVRRSKSDVEAIVWGLTHDWDRLLRDLKSYEDNEAPAEFLFPRHATVCSEFGCPYEDICRSRLDEGSPPPLTGFIKRAPVKHEALSAPSILSAGPIVGSYE